MRWRSRARRWGLAVALVAIAVFAVTRAAPRVASARIRAALAAAGFPDARFRVTEVGIEHVRLAEVRLGEDFVLGDVEIDTGIAALWGRPASVLAIRGARVTAHQLARALEMPGATTVRTVAFTESTLATGDIVLAVAGTVAIVPGRPALLDATGHADRCTIAGLAFADAVVHARGAVDALALDLHARLATAREVVLDGGAVAASGTLDATRTVLDASGHITAARASVGNVALRALGAAIAVHGEGDPSTWQPSITWTAAHASWNHAELDDVGGTVVPARSVRWHARAGRWHGARFRAPSGTIDLGRSRYTLAWTAIAGPGPLVFGEGTLDARSSTRGTTLQARAGAMGGHFTLAPVTLGAGRSSTLRVNVEGLQLARALAATGTERLRGDGVLDGYIALAFDSSGLTSVGGTLHGRGPGQFELRDTALPVISAPLPGVKPQRPPTGDTLRYSQLGATVRPDLEIELSLSGRSEHFRAPIDLTVRVHGVRDLVHSSALAHLLGSNS